MTPEQLLLAGLTFVTTTSGTVLSVVVRQLWARVRRTEADLIALRADYDKLLNEHGIATGTLSLYRRCRAPACPFADTPAVLAH